MLNKYSQWNIHGIGIEHHHFYNFFLANHGSRELSTSGSGGTCMLLSHSLAQREVLLD
jgi:hypothetical protein